MSDPQNILHRMLLRTIETDRIVNESTCKQYKTRKNIFKLLQKHNDAVAKENLVLSNFISYTSNKTFCDGPALDALQLYTQDLEALFFVSKKHEELVSPIAP